MVTAPLTDAVLLPNVGLPESVTALAIDRAAVPVERSVVAADIVTRPCQRHCRPQHQRPPLANVVPPLYALVLLVSVRLFPPIDASVSTPVPSVICPLNVGSLLAIDSVAAPVPVLVIRPVASNAAELDRLGAVVEVESSFKR